jgi:hypothetical protein
VGDGWLEIPDEEVDAEEIMEQIRARAADRVGTSSYEKDEDPVAAADALRQEMLENASGGEIPIQRRECDIVPRNYVIGWRVPILGPIHALVRRLINTEIRRYLSSSLERQSYLNRQLLRVLDGLVEENKCLRREIEELRESQG